jgi:hypothetical protein
MPAFIQGRVSDKIYNTSEYKIKPLIFAVNYVIIITRTAGPTDKPLISFFQAKKERVKVSFLFPGCPLYSHIQ